MYEKIYCLIGKFATSKTVVAKILEKKYKIKRVVTCTNRNPRDGEVDGKDYYFLTDKKFDDLKRKDKLIAVNEILIDEKAKKYKKYGIPFEKIDLKKDFYICVIEPSGYYDLVNIFGKENVKCIYMTLDDKERWIRALNRESAPDCNEIAKRHLDELTLFDNFQSIADKVIDSAGSPEDVAKEIVQYITEEGKNN